MDGSSSAHADARLAAQSLSGQRDRLWLTWERQRRNRTLSQAVAAELQEMNLPGGRVQRYGRLIVRTLSLLLRRRPALVFVQNPSMVLALLTVLWGRLARRPVVVDAHNAGVRPFDGARAWANRLAAFLFRNAALTIVSNPALETVVQQAGGRVLALPDPIPDLVPGQPAQAAERFEVLFVCTWAADEPYLEVLRAARDLPEEVRICVTGNSKGRERALEGELPSNVELLGFVAEDEFVRRLQRCQVVMDLTTREDCLVCGAYEATAVEKPMILSDTACLRGYFDKGAIYTANDATAIAAAVRRSVAEIESLDREVRQLKQEKLIEWDARLAEAERVFRQLQG